MKKTVFSLILLLGTMTFCGARAPQNVRILYWNIQNGMWSDQGNNYDNFVEFVKEQAPDVCVWAEAKTHYKTATEESFKPTDELYLPKHWKELAARYGHKYVYLGGERDFFPQVITSRFPISNVKRITGDENGILVVHGCGWATIKLGGKKVNFVTVHTWPQKYGFGIERSERPASIEKHEGDYFRRTEMQFICEQTIFSHKNAEKEYWMMLGDFNAVSIVDNFHYGYPEDDTRFLVHKYIAQNTPYRDIVALRYPSEFQRTTLSGRRIDFVYMTDPLYSCLKDVRVLYDGFAKNYRDTTGLKHFCHPSDHCPILMNLLME